MHSISPFITTVQPSPVLSASFFISKASTVFNATFSAAASLGSAAITAIYANIIPLGIGLIGVSLAVAFIWKKVYGVPAPQSSPQTAPQAAPQAAAPSPQVAAPAPVLPRPATPDVDLPTDEPIKATSSSSKGSKKSKKKSKTPGESNREKIQSFLKALNLSEIKSSRDLHYTTRARVEKVRTVDGHHFCIFEEDHEGFKAGALYPILGWEKGKQKNDYLVLEKLPETINAQTPRVDDDAHSCDSDASVEAVA